jgi:hypothetical protein
LFEKEHSGCPEQQLKCCFGPANMSGTHSYSNNHHHLLDAAGRLKLRSRREESVCASIHIKRIKGTQIHLKELNRDRRRRRE